MGIVLAVKKNGVICIAGDSMYISPASRKYNADSVANTDKIIPWGNSYMGIASDPIWPLILKNYIATEGKEAIFSSEETIFVEWLKLHHHLKEKYYLNTKPNEEEEETFESSRLETLIANPYGIFKVYELRSVQQFTRFEAIGSGAPYALGALSVLYSSLSSAEEIAKEALNIVVNFDDSSALPATFYQVKIN